MPSIEARGLDLRTPAGRPLFRDLCVVLDRRDRVALVGRNGVGKSTLLRVLAGEVDPHGGALRGSGRRVLVPQLLPQHPSVSPGERRRRALEAAFAARPDFLLLDEPTHDLDADNVEWLAGELGRFPGGLVVVSHDRRLLRTLDDFFVATETGCHHVGGGFEALVARLEEDRRRAEASYVSHLHRLEDRERRSDRVRRRRERKKNVGRVRELGRAPSRAKLNGKRGYAQASQGKRAVLRRDRIGAARRWAEAARRALSVDLPLDVAVPALPPPTGGPVVVLEGVGVDIEGRALLSGLSLSIGRERIGVVGPNGSGKSTLLSIVAAEREPSRGRARRDPARLGYVAQDAVNWCRPESLLDELARLSDLPDVESVVATLRAHRFPLALAERPLASLSPGERLRAALLCILGRRPVPELLVLDEPTDHLDFLGLAAVEAVLSAWTGGLLVVSHDRELLDALDLDDRITLCA